MKNILITFILSCSIAFAVDFSYSMSKDDVVSYIAENSENPVDYRYNSANVLKYLYENENATYNEIVNLVGKEDCCHAIYQISMSDSELNERCRILLIGQLKDKSSLSDVEYFNLIVCSSDFHVHKSNPEYGIYDFLVSNFTNEEIKQKIVDSMNVHIETAISLNEYSKKIDGVLNSLAKSYQLLYLCCDENKVKSELKDLSEKSSPLLSISSEYKVFVKKLRKFYKSLDL